MEKLRPLLIAVPSFLLGGVAFAMLTTSARAQSQTTSTTITPASSSSVVGATIAAYPAQANATTTPASASPANGVTGAGRARARSRSGAKPIYHIVTDEATMNRYAQEGYEVKMATATANWATYLMKRTQ